MLPAAPWKVPGSHVEQRDTLPLEYMPGLHFDGSVEPVAQNEPAGQGVQSSAAALPTVAEYLPALQSVAVFEPRGQKAPTGHSSHSLRPSDAW